MSLMDLLMRTELFEMAFERKVMIEKCRSLSSQICFHIIKLTCFNNPDDIRGHLKSLNGWIGDIYSQKLKTPKKNKKLPANVYYDEIWFNRVDDYIQLKDMSLYLKRTDYKKVELREVNYKNLYNKLCDMMNDVCHDIENDKLEDFEFYLDKHEIEYK